MSEAPAPTVIGQITVVAEAEVVKAKPFATGGLVEAPDDRTDAEPPWLSGCPNAGLVRSFRIGPAVSAEEDET